jgi:hypothetical protein
MLQTVHFDASSIYNDCWQRTNRYKFVNILCLVVNDGAFCGYRIECTDGFAGALVQVNEQNQKIVSVMLMAHLDGFDVNGVKCTVLIIAREIFDFWFDLERREENVAQQQRWYRRLGLPGQSKTEADVARQRFDTSFSGTYESISHGYRTCLQRKQLGEVK